MLNHSDWTLEDVTEFINSIEDADVVEAKHGKWVFAGYSLKGEKVYVCSECNFAVTNIDEVEMKYCGGCGAKMDERSDT